MIRQLLALLLGCSLGLWEVAARPFFPSWLGARPLLPVLVIVVATSVRSRAWALAIAGGLVLDAYWIGTPIAATLRLLILAILLDMAARQFFTNRSLYAVVGMVVCGRVLDWIGAWIIGGVSVLVGRSTVGTEVDPAWLVVLIWDVLIAGGGFLLIASLTRRLLLGQTVRRYG